MPLPHIITGPEMSVEGKLRALQEPGWRFQPFIFLWPRLSQVPPLQDRFCSQDPVPHHWLQLLLQTIPGMSMKQGERHAGRQADTRQE